MSAVIRLSFCVLIAFPLSIFAQQPTGTIQGQVILQDRNVALHNASILLVELGRAVQSSDEGRFEFLNVPVGAYDIVANAPGMSSEVQRVDVVAGQVTMADFALRLSTIRQEITVTATGVQETAFESFQVVNALDSFALAEQGATAVGEVLSNEPGVAKRSQGPGASRPVIRGFDGDRVLVLQDGVRTGSLASQSADHGEPIDVLQLERLEVVKGPATLMYGSNAIGGVVNAISGHLQMEERPREGFRGYLTGLGGSANRYGGGGLGFEYGVKKWLFWGSGGNQKTGDFKSPIGSISNTQTRISTGTAGLGWYTARGFLGLNYNYDDGRYGIPFVETAEDHSEAGHEHHKADIDYFRRNLRLSGGTANHNSFIEHIRFDLNYSGWIHREVEKEEDSSETVGTSFDNKQYSYQIYLDHRRGKLSGTFGVSGIYRDYDVEGVEALSPPVKQDVASTFALQELNLGRFKIQYGGRLEYTRYRPEGGLRSRSFTGASASAGIHVPLWANGAFVANFTHSHRAPAMEELYNNGPHLGNLAFEIGSPDLKSERGDGLDLSIRHLSDTIRFDSNFFFYDLGNFVFLAPTGEEREGLIEAAYAQGRAHYAGIETSLNFPVSPNLYINTGVDYVRAQLRSQDTPLPRIPPLRARIGLDARFGGMNIKPEMTLMDRQDRVFATETPTAGYATFDIAASYTFPRQHFSHHFSVNFFNLGNTLYRNHVSLIKDLVPEIGRGVRVTYSMKFF